MAALTWPKAMSLAPLVEVGLSLNAVDLLSLLTIIIE